jgi:hypothetical protein
MPAIAPLAPSKVFPQKTGRPRPFPYNQTDLNFWVAMEALHFDLKTVLLAIAVPFTLSCLFFGTRNGFYDTDKYHGNGSAH